MKKKISASPSTGNSADVEYDSYLSHIQDRYDMLARHHMLFTTDAADLWSKYLNSFPAKERQHHNCHCCKQFIERYGGLVVIAPDGTTASAIWNLSSAPDRYKKSIAAMLRAVEKAKVTGVFVSKNRVWGTPKTGPWTHLHVTPPTNIIHTARDQTAFQRMAEKKEDFKNVLLALQDFSPAALDAAVVLLKSSALYRPEKVLAGAEWLRSLQISFRNAPSQYRTNLVWRAVAHAPAGFCHPRGGMLGTLIEDIEAGKSTAEIARSFAEKMDGLRYQRPTAPPSEGTIQQAEKLFAERGLAGSLKRRFCRLDEVKAIWTPNVSRPVPATGSLFGHLKAKPLPSAGYDLEVPEQIMTWEKFQRTVFPEAQGIRCKVPYSGSFTALVTAADMSTPPILQWDTEAQRNPVSWYFWHGGASASQFNLSAGSYVPVQAVTYKPSMWYGEHPNHGKTVIFILEGARESRMAGNALFPEILKAELHGVRSVIEAYSKSAVIEGKDEPHAAGLAVSDGAGVPWNLPLKVTIAGRVHNIKLDRWD